MLVQSNGFGEHLSSRSGIFPEGGLCYIPATGDRINFYSTSFQLTHERIDRLKS